MTGNIDRNISDLTRDAKQQSEIALLPYLKLHIFGAYQNDCFAYLWQVQQSLQNHGYFETALCADRDGSPSPSFSDTEEDAFWRDESLRFVENADVAVFIFLDHTFERETLPDRARKQAKPVEENDEKPREINSSVSSELENWIQTKHRPQERTLLLIEDGIESHIGAVPSGVRELEGIDYDTVPNESVDITVDKIKSRAKDWVFGEMRDELAKRHQREHF